MKSALIATLALCCAASASAQTLADSLRVTAYQRVLEGDAFSFDFELYVEGLDTTDAVTGTALTYAVPPEGRQVFRVSTPSAFARERGSTHPVLLADDETLEAYRIYASPTYIVVGPDGTILYHAVHDAESEINTQTALADFLSTLYPPARLARSSRPTCSQALSKKPAPFSPSKNSKAGVGFGLDVHSRRTCAWTKVSPWTARASRSSRAMARASRP